MATYDIEQVSMTVNGVPITGIDPSSGLELDAEEIWQTITGTHGSWTRSRVYGDVPTIDVALMQESNGNAVFSEYKNLDKATGRGTFSFQIYNGNSGTVVRSSAAFVASSPAATFAGEAGSITWTIAIPNAVRDIRPIPAI